MLAQVHHQFRSVLLSIGQSLTFAFGPRKGKVDFGSGYGIGWQMMML